MSMPQLLRVVGPSRQSGHLDKVAVDKRWKMPVRRQPSDWLETSQYKCNAILVYISFRSERIAMHNQSSYKRQLIPVLKQDINHSNDNVWYSPLYLINACSLLAKLWLHPNRLPRTLCGVAICLIYEPPVSSAQYVHDLDENICAIGLRMHQFCY